MSEQLIGRYRIIEKIGEGGMAEVYRAFDPSLEREVAIKLLHVGLVDDEIARKRFQRETKSLSQLTHPNIVSLLEAGRIDERVFLVMEYLPGGTLKKLLGLPMPFDQAARLLAPIARALAYAHQQGIIHRDVKPSNILLTQSANPMLSDFGIARTMTSEDQTQLTSTGEMLGSPDYLSPEIAAGYTADARSDIYSLGLVLYELITGRKPFEADAPVAVMLMHAKEVLPRPARFVRKLPVGVEKVLFKACAKRPEDRFQTMTEFADILNRMGNGQVDFAINVHIPVQQLPAWIWMGACVTIIALILLGAAWFLGPQFVRKQPVKTSIAAVIPTSTPTETIIPSPSPTLLPTATVTFTPVPTDPPLPTATLFHPSLRDTPIPLSNQPITLENATQLVELARLGTSQIGDIAIAPNGVFTAASTSTGIYINDIETGKIIKIIESDVWIRNVLISPDSTLLAGWGEDDLVKIWDIASQKKIKVLGTRNFKHIPDYCSKWGVCEHYHGVGIVFSPDGKNIAVATSNNTVILWEINTEKRLYELDIKAPVISIAFSTYGDFFVTGAANGAAQVWNTQDGTLRYALVKPVKPLDAIRNVAVSPDNQWILVEDCIWRVRDSAFIRCGSKGIDRTASIEIITPDNQWILIGGTNDDALGKSFKIVDFKKETQQSYSYPGVRSFNFKNSGKVIVIASLTGAVRELQFDNGLVTKVIREIQLDIPSRIPDGFALSPDDQQIASYSPLTLWDIRSGKILAVFPYESITTAGFASDQKAIYTITQTMKLNVIDLKGLSVKLINEIFLSGANSFLGLPMAPDGKTFLSSGVVNMWRTIDGYRLLEPEKYGGFAFYAPDSQAFDVLFSNRGAFHLRNLKNKNEVGKLPLNINGFYLNGYELYISSVSFSKDFNKLAICLNDGRVILWMKPLENSTDYFLLGNKQVSGPRFDESSYQHQAVFSPDNKLLASGDNRGTIHIWDADTGKSVMDLNGHLGLISALIFSSDGKFLASSSEDGTIRIWGITDKTAP